MKKVIGKAIFKGEAEGEILISFKPISFLGDVDPETGRIVNKDLEIFDEVISGKVLFFPKGIGSTVGSYVLYELKKNLKAPAGIVCYEAEPIISVGAIISRIPTISGIKPEEAIGYRKARINGNRLLLF